MIVGDFAASSNIRVPVFRRDLLDDAAGVVGGEDALGDVVDDDRADDERARADGHARHDAHHPADPYIVAHRDEQ